MTTKHRHVGLAKIDECVTCQDKMIKALELLGYGVTVETQYECVECGSDLKAVDGVWWHAGERGDYQPVSHSAVPVPREVRK